MTHNEFKEFWEENKTKVEKVGILLLELVLETRKITKALNNFISNISSEAEEKQSLIDALKELEHENGGLADICVGRWDNKFED